MTAQDIITGLHQAIDAERKRTVADGMTVQGEELRQFVERYERLESEKKDATDAQKEVMAEAGGRGYDVKVLRKIIAMRQYEQMYAAVFGQIQKMGPLGSEESAAIFDDLDGLYETDEGMN